jgi:hypothetical protein
LLLVKADGIHAEPGLGRYSADLESCRQHTA